jgi:hypothetical protein
MERDLLLAEFRPISENEVPTTRRASDSEFFHANRMEGCMTSDADISGRADGRCHDKRMEPCFHPIGGREHLLRGLRVPCPWGV